MPLQITLIKSALCRQGGIEKYTWRMAEEFCKRGAEVTLLTTENPTAPFHSPSLRIISFPIRHPISVLNILHFDKACTAYLKEHPTPIIFSLDRNSLQTHHRAGNGVHAAYLLQRRKEESLCKGISFSLNPLHRTLLRLEKEAFEHPRLQTLFTNSHMVKEDLLRHYSTDPGKIAVVHNGVEWTAMREPFDKWPKEKAQVAAQFGLDAKAFQFLFLGHNFQRKGLEKLLNALSRISHEDFQLSVIGKEKDLPYFQMLTERLGLAKKIFFLGPQKDPLPFYQLADSLVIPSLYDPFANVTLEGISMGLFTLSSIYNGGKEVLNAVNGAVVPDLDDQESFAACLLDAMRRPKTLERARAIRATAEHLDFPHQLKKISDITIS